MRQPGRLRSGIYSTLALAAAAYFLADGSPGWGVLLLSITVAHGLLVHVRRHPRQTVVKLQNSRMPAAASSRP
jgi:hypothetical protein